MLKLKNDDIVTLESLISQETGEESVTIVFESFPKDLIISMIAAFKEFQISAPSLVQTGNGLRIETTGDFFISCLSIGYALACDAYLSANKE